MATDKVSVIIPAFNEEKGIGSVIENARKHAGEHAEIIVVDDGSTDRTSQVAEAAGATLVRHPINGGYGKSLKSGIASAEHETIVIVDADGTYPVERIPDLLKKLNEGFDMVVGARHGMYYRGLALKMPARIIFKIIVEFSTGRRIPDINSGLRAFRKKQVMRYFDDLCDGFSFTTTITLIYSLTGKFIAYIPIKYDKRIGSSKVRIIRDSFRTLQYIVEVLLHYNPIKLFLLSAIFLFVASMIVAWILDFQYEVVQFGIALSVVVLFMGFVAEAMHNRHVKN